MIKLTMVILLASAALAQEKAARVQFDWDKLAAKASETMDVNLEGPTLELATKFLGDTEDAQIKRLVQGLKGVYVKTFEFDKEGQYSAADLGAIRSQLRSPEWSTIIDSREKTESVTVYVKTDGKQTQGLVVVSAEPKELTFVQIVGPLDPSMLADLSGKLGIPKMELGLKPPPKPAPKKND